MTSVPRVFAAGDVEPAPRSVTVAIGHGNAAAPGVDAWLRRQPGRDPDTPVAEPREPEPT